MGRLLWDVRVDRCELVPIVLIDLVASSQYLIVHARICLGAVVIQAEGVPDLLAGYVIDSGLRVTRGISHVGIIDFRRRTIDVASAVNAGERRQPQPARLAISAIKQSELGRGAVDQRNDGRIPYGDRTAEGAGIAARASDHAALSDSICVTHGPG